MTETTNRDPMGIGMPIGLATTRLDHMPEAFRPLIELGMKLQSDWMELFGHRAKAWAEWPQTLANCKDMDDLTQAQRDYVVTMQHDYAQFLDRYLQDAMIEQDEYNDEEKTAPAPIERQAA